MNKESTTEGNFDRLLKAVEVAKILNISRAMAYQLMKQGKIQTIHIGASRRVRPADLQEFITQNICSYETGDE